jgi:hypothetical protein
LKEKDLWIRKLSIPIVIAEVPLAIVGNHPKLFMRKCIKK